MLTCNEIAIVHAHNLIFTFCRNNLLWEAFTLPVEAVPFREARYWAGFLCTHGQCRAICEHAKLPFPFCPTSHLGSIEIQ